MDPELRRYIHETTLNRAAIRHIQTMLPDDTELDARVRAYELAYQMQSAASDAVDASGATLENASLGAGSGAMKWM